MAKIENEQVVNRFLLSTTYAIISGLLLYFLYMRGLSNIWINDFYQVMYIVSAVATVFFAVRKFVFKKGTGYHFVFFAGLTLIFIFLRFGGISVRFSSGYKRVLISGVVVAVMYAYEIIRYLIFARK